MLEREKSNWFLEATVVVTAVLVFIWDTVTLIARMVGFFPIHDAEDVWSASPIPA